MYLSKSKVNSYLQCPKQFKYSYIDKLPTKYNPYFDVGLAVHEFHDKLFDLVSIEGCTLKIPHMNYHKKLSPGFEEHEYKIPICNYNIVRYYISHWEKCVNTKEPKKYFMPVLKEQKLFIQDMKVNGIPDMVEKNFDDELVVVEVKTGQPTQQKIEEYKNDLVWYKLLYENNFAGQKIYNGRIFFPINNSNYPVSISDKEVENLKLQIEDVRMEIESNHFQATPNHLCLWCNYQKICKEAKI